MNPVIDSAVATPGTVKPKGSFVVTFVAHDPDEQLYNLTGTVKDAAGNETSTAVLIRVSDPLTYALVAPAGAAFTILPRAGSPNVFDCVAP